MNPLLSRILATFTLALALVLLTPAYAVELLRWERLPLVIPLVVDQERVVFIDRNIRVGVPASLGDRLRVQSSGGAIYLRANAPIEPTRLQLQDTDNGAVILVDITAERAQADQSPLEPVRIVETTASSQPQDDLSVHIPKVDVASALQQKTPIPVVLTRYAAQSLYAPLRTLEPVPGIAPVNQRRLWALDTLLPTLPVQAQAVAAWRLDKFWVSAVRLRNTSPRWLDLDPRFLQGKFVTATFQHPNLGPAGTPEDTTVVYLITHGYGLAQALLPTISPVDPALNLPIHDAPGIDHGGIHAQ